MRGRRSYAEGDRVEILVATRDSENWVGGVVAGSHASPWEDEGFQRYDVTTGDGLEFRGCHPDCMRLAAPEAVA